MDMFVQQQAQLWKSNKQQLCSKERKIKWMAFEIINKKIDSNTNKNVTIHEYMWSNLLLNYRYWQTNCELEHALDIILISYEGL